MWVLITTAGGSKRFKAEGYTKSKALLNLRSPEGVEDLMINHVRRSIPEGHNILIAHTEKYFPLQPHDFRVYLPSTVGQADTILQTLAELPPDKPIIVLDCDTILEQRDIKVLIDSLQIYDVTLAVTETFDPNASRVDQVPFPTLFVEKEPLSQWGIIGARGFSDIGLLTYALQRTMGECRHDGTEPYLSMAMNHYTGSKFAHVIDTYVDLGTPERVRNAGWEIL